MQYSEIVPLLNKQKYIKELDLGDKKILFYYCNKSTSTGGGVSVYVVDAETVRPERQEQLTSFIASGKTTAFSGVPNYTKELHKMLFDTKNKLF